MTKKLQAYSVFLPRHRLSRKELPNGGTGARAVAGYDEDVITMARRSAPLCDQQKVADHRRQADIS